jgi:hypothetical protein
MDMPPRGIPLRPDRDLLGRAAATSFIRACTAAMTTAANPAMRPADYAAKAWPNDRDVGTVLRTTTSPTTTANASALVRLCQVR